VTARQARARVAIGSDDVGREPKEALAAHLRGLPGGPVCLDLSPAGRPELDVPEVARRVAESIRRGEADRGVLVCGTGAGMVIAANKVPGIRAAQCHDVYAAEHARNSNDVQVLVFGSRVVGSEPAKEVLEAWLGAEFEPNQRRRRRMAKLAALERSYLAPTPRSRPRR
jgi:ribose 5-phosphate isomerase B